MDNKMFCYQCQETAKGTGCTVSGVCGKNPEVAGMQDLLIYVTKGLAAVATKLREEGKTVGKEVNHRITLNLFTTITNANFDKENITEYIKDTLRIKEELLTKVDNNDGLPEAALWSDDEAELQDFMKRKYQYMAKDREGRDVYLADSSYVLSMAQQDFKHIRFHFTSEF